MNRVNMYDGSANEGKAGDEVSVDHVEFVVPVGISSWVALWIWISGTKDKARDTDLGITAKGG